MMRNVLRAIGGAGSPVYSDGTGGTVAARSAGVARGDDYAREAGDRRDGVVVVLLRRGVGCGCLTFDGGQFGC